MDYIQNPSGYWAHPEVPYFAFPQKPPEWIKPYLKKLFKRAYDLGFEKGREPFNRLVREALDDT